MTVGITYHVSQFQVRRAERLGLKTPPAGFYRVEANGKYRNLDNHRLYAKTTVENARFGRDSRRKGWDSLSPTYRARLEKRGINRDAYNRGAKLQAARGHVNETIPKQYQLFTTKGDTDYYAVPKSDAMLGRLLQYLLAKGYTGVRAVYETTTEKDGEIKRERESTHWFRLDEFNLSRITESFVLEQVASSSDPKRIFTRSLMILLAVVDSLTKRKR